MAQPWITTNDPHEGQVRMAREAKRWNVACVGRRWGKTDMAQTLATECIAQGEAVGWFAPTYANLAPVHSWVQESMGGLITGRIEPHGFKFATGGIWEFWSLNHEALADSVRGHKYHLVIVDEAAVVDGLLDTWSKVIRPTLIDYRGDAWFYSTPRGYNDFYELFQRGQSPAYPSWRSWQMPTWTNPHLSRDEIEEMRLEYTDRPSAWAQEIEAVFTAPEGLVLGLDYDGIPIYATNRNIAPAPAAWRDCKWRVVGVDPGGSTGDPAGLVAVGITQDERHHVYAAVSRSGMVGAQDVHEWIRSLGEAGHARVDRVLVGETGGDSFTTTLARFGLPAFVANKGRSVGIPHLQHLFRSGRLTIPPELRPSMEEEIYAWSFAPKRAGRTSNDPWATVSGSSKHHADRLDALRYACMGVLDMYPAASPPHIGQVGRGEGALRLLGA